MIFWKLLALIFIFSSPVSASISVYFNQNQQSHYTDPYRKISRHGDNLEEVIVNQIKDAKKSIFVAVQELRLPLIAKALIDKKNEGLDVRVILEHDYNYNILAQRDSSSDEEYEASRLNELKAFVDLNKDGRIQKEELESRDAIYMLQAANIKILDDTSDNSKGSGLVHHKFIIIDGKTTIVSTANFTMSCIHGDMLTMGSRGNSNSLVVIESVNLARIFNDEFSQLWGSGKIGNFGQSKTYRGPVSTVVKGSRVTVQFSPTSQRYNWEESGNGLIASHLYKARSSIKAALFVFSDQKLANVMQQKHEKGVDVGVIIEPKFAYRDYSELLDLMGLEMFSQKCTIEPNNNPWKSPAREVGMATMTPGDVLHHKFAVVDQSSVIVGSQNWSDAANFVNDETILVIQDPIIADKYYREYERVRQKARLGPTDWILDQIRRQDEICH